ncbi:hypothetical protein HHL21_08685 [Massilia sp. RP-1-19]|uniref:Uncharacterized protein n=1 Tax=Massilia polaris TaxID=2728846 RepID=A0A848HIY8_9BURK|nr:hypothetical protein [Massilia polaris]NML61154.1 hypothetical protein [Massilia polaris]
MESDPNRLEAENTVRELADLDASLAPAPELAGLDAGPAAAPEPDFSMFDPPVRESLLPRRLYLPLLWVFGLGAIAALALAGSFVSQERKSDKTMQLLAANSRSAIGAPVVPVAAPLPVKKPTDMVFLKEASPTGPVRTDKQPDTAVEGVAKATQPVAESQKEPKADSQPAVARIAKASPTKVKPAAKAAPAKATPVAKKKKSTPPKATVFAQRGPIQNGPRVREESITERLNAAVAACRARPHAPGECNLRACDILGSSDPACR